MGIHSQLRLVARRSPAAVAVLTAQLVLLVTVGCDKAPVAPAEGATAVKETPAAPPAPRSPNRSSVKDNPAGWPPVEFEPAELNFGILEPGAVGKGMVRIWNVGTEPLEIVTSRTSCGCTTTGTLAGRSIPVGGSIDFDTTMEMKSGLGEKMEKVRILFRGYDQTFVEFFYKAEVSLPVRVVPPHMTAVQSMTGQMEVSSLDGSPFSVLAVQGAAPDFVGFDPATEPPQAQYTLRWDLTELDARGEVPWFWVIETDRADAPIVDVRVRHNSTRSSRVRNRPWVPEDQRVVIGAVRPGEPVEVTARMEYHGNMTPDPASGALTGRPEQMQVELVDVVRDGQFLKFKLRVTPDPGPTGLLYGLVELQASGFPMPLRIIGRRLDY